MNRVLPALSLITCLALTACAPTATTRAAVSTDTVFLPGGPLLAQICAGRGRVAEGGSLIWDAPDSPDSTVQPASAVQQTSTVQESRQAPYLVSCRNFTLKNDGATLSVQDDTLASALTHFDPDASFLVYYADLSLRFPEPGLVGADPADTVPEVLLGTLRRVRVTATQAGTPEKVLLAGGQMTAVRYDPARPLTLRLQAAGIPAPWPEVTIEASKGLITAPIYR